MTFKFGENETVADLEVVDENLRPFYVKNEGSEAFTIREDLQGVAKAWDGINNANASIRKENKNLSTGKIDLAGLSEYGTTPAEILETFKTRTKEMNDALEKKEGHVNPEKIRVEMKKAHTAELEEVNKRAGSYKEQLYNTLVTNEAMKAISEHKGNADLLLGFVTKSVVMKDVDGRLEPWVIDEDGDRRMGGAGSYMTVPELVKNMKGEKKYAALFDADVTNGSNAPNNRSPSGGPQPAGQKRSASDRIQAALEKRAGR
jgi:hypothetical protein